MIVSYIFYRTPLNKRVSCIGDSHLFFDSIILRFFIFKDKFNKENFL